MFAIALNYAPHAAEAGFEPPPDREKAPGPPWLGSRSGSTSQLIFPIDDLVARLSAVCPLLPGDLIFTGTPDGVGEIRQTFAAAHAVG